MNGGSDDGGLDGVGAFDPKTQFDGVEGSAGAASVESADPSGQTEAVRGVDELAGVDSDTRISEELATGRIDADQAIAQLVDETLAAQLPADASPELVAALREQIAAMLADDPTVAAMLRADG